MDHATWRRLAQRVAQHLARPEVGGVVITHGTDTLEETAYFLHRLLDGDKPVVFTAAMRPATALAADGPQNLLDAMTVARQPGVRGVLVVVGGRVLAAAELRKQHPYRVDALGVGDAGPLAVVEEGRLRVFRAWPGGGDAALCARVLAAEPAAWPWVEVLASHAGARPQALRALLAAGVQGVVLATTGNGSVHQALAPALDEARAAGVPVWLASRTGDGVLVGPVAQDQPAAALTPWQARVALLLHLLAQRAG